MTKYTVGLLVLCMVLLGAVLPAAAQPEDEVVILAGEDEKPITDARVIPDTFDIGVNGYSFFVIRTSAAGFSAAERARIVDTRVVHILSYADVREHQVRVEAIRGKPTIYVDDVRLITVYPNDAEAAGAASSWDLANSWAASTACCLQNYAPLANLPEAGAATTVE